MTSKYEFLADLHKVLQPRNYLEIGVQTGGSLNLARCPAIGIDPAPLVPAGPSQMIYSVTSDEFFASSDCLLEKPIDLIFIDGMHLFEFALRDFMNVQILANERTVVVIDDVMPYNEAIATREQPPGDWTGDVWKLVEILDEYTSDTCLVDVTPTGVLLAWNVDLWTRHPEPDYEQNVAKWMDKPMSEWVLNKQGALTAEQALDKMRQR